jgi:hypothetical protein
MESSAMELTILIVAIAALIVLAATSIRFGAESRHGFREEHPLRSGFRRNGTPTGSAA